MKRKQGFVSSKQKRHYFKLRREAPLKDWNGDDIAYDELAYSWGCESHDFLIETVMHAISPSALAPLDMMFPSQFTLRTITDACPASPKQASVAPDHLARKLYEHIRDFYRAETGELAFDRCFEIRDTLPTYDEVRRARRLYFAS
jgi:hypothetical protein